MTEKQAYAAMFHFLEEWWKEAPSDISNLSNLLSVMSLLPDGKSVDPAIDEKWQRAVQYALNGGEAGAFELLQE